MPDFGDQGLEGHGLLLDAEVASLPAALFEPSLGLAALVADWPQELQRAAPSALGAAMRQPRWPACGRLARVVSASIKGLIGLS